MSYENIDLWDAMKAAKCRQSIDEIQNIVGSADDLSSAIKGSLALVCKTLHANVGTFWVFNHKGDGLIRAVATYGSANLDDVNLLPGEGIVGETIENGLSTIIYDCQKDNNYSDKNIQTMMCSPLNYKGCSFAAIQIIDKDDETLYDDNDLKLLEDISQAITENLVKRNLIAGFISGVSGKQRANLSGGKFCDVTTMFIDIGNFTGLIDDVGINNAIRVLNAFLIYTTAIIKENGGFIDKYMGDRIMATWGAPNECQNGAYKALKAAILINKNKNELVEKIKNSCDVELSFSIGISTGLVYAGVIGEKSISDYTVVGDSVNIASKLCRAAKKDEILTTLETLRDVGSNNVRYSQSKTEVTYKNKIKIPVFQVESIV